MNDKKNSIPNKITPSYDTLIGMVKDKLRKDNKLSNMIDEEKLVMLMHIIFKNQNKSDTDIYMTKPFRDLIDDIVDDRYEKGEKI